MASIHEQAIRQMADVICANQIDPDDRSLCWCVLWERGWRESALNTLLDDARCMAMTRNANEKRRGRADRSVVVTDADVQRRAVLDFYKCFRVINEEWITRAMPYSKSGVKRLRATAFACLNVDRRGIEGAFVECGVWRGGNVMVARWASPSRQCWLYDTFSGMTEPGIHDTKRSGDPATERWIGKAAVSAVDVFGNLLDVRACDHEYDHINFVEGDVRQTLLDEKNLPKQIAVLRLDTDFYDSTKIEMEKLYPRLTVGGYLIVDDYGHWLGARKAVDEYLGNARKYLAPIDYSGFWMVKQ